MFKEKGCKVILLSGRDESCREETDKWLDRWGIFYDQLIMRTANDNRKDSIIKEELFNEHIKNKYNIHAVFDDRDQVVAVWRKLGLKCFQVEYGHF
jgi:hypothetical protein